MKVIIGETAFIIKWRHWEKYGPHQTDCTISAEGSPIRSMGFALCGPKDQFCKNTGRKISMTRALKCFKREVRKVFWEEYFKISKRRG